MDNKDFAKKLEKRSKQFAIRIIKVSAELPNTAEGNVIRYQIVKSGTSIGANSGLIPLEKIKADYKECSRLLAIFTSIGRSGKEAKSVKCEVQS